MSPDHFTKICTQKINQYSGFFLPSPYLQALNFGVSGLGKSKRLNSGSVLFPFTLKLRFTATSTACGSDLQIYGPYSKDALSPVVTSLILLVYSSFFFFFR